MPSEIQKENLKDPQDWVRSILRYEYNDGQRIKQGLDELFPDKQYRLSLRTERWVISAPRKLTNVRKRRVYLHAIEESNLLKVEKSKLQGNAYVHY
ncbi:hypothetical protein F4677DRAFT_436734 [Hypoxylon crocopeplum]|nr:hypothetical protein F4677DRAFT_436734 [Hypoxylon crocopeplum]